MCSNTIRQAWVGLLLAGCGRRSSGLDVCSAVYRYYFCTNAQCLLPALKGEGRFANWVMTQAFWLAALKIDGRNNDRKYYWVILYLLVENMVTMATVILHVGLAIIQKKCHKYTFADEMLGQQKNTWTYDIPFGTTG